MLEIESSKVPSQSKIRRLNGPGAGIAAASSGGFIAEKAGKVLARV
jgi:hypothetical protein